MLKADRKAWRGRATHLGNHPFNLRTLVVVSLTNTELGLDILHNNWRSFEDWCRDEQRAVRILQAETPRSRPRALSPPGSVHTVTRTESEGLKRLKEHFSLNDRVRRTVEV